MTLKRQSPKYHTPLILRFGILHSYWRTLPLLAFIFFADLALQWLAGIPLGWIPVLTNLAALIGIWVIRDTVAGYADLFDVFDFKIEQKLKLYKSMIRPPSAVKDDIRNLFREPSAYSAFREKVRRNLFQRTELWAFVFASVSFLVWNGVSLVFEWSRTPRVGAFRVGALDSLHKVLARAKKAVLDVHEEEYEHLKVQFMSELRELRTTRKDRRHVKSVSDVGTDLGALQTILAETRGQRTWAVGPPMVAKVIGTSLIPVVIAILEGLGALGTLAALLAFLPP